MNSIIYYGQIPIDPGSLLVICEATFVINLQSGHDRCPRNSKTDLSSKLGVVGSVLYVCGIKSQQLGFDKAAQF